MRTIHGRTTIEHLQAMERFASRRTSKAEPLTPEQQSLADEWSLAWTKAGEQLKRTGLPATLEYPRKQSEPEP